MALVVVSGNLFVYGSLGRSYAVTGYMNLGPILAIKTL